MSDFELTAEQQEVLDVNHENIWRQLHTVKLLPQEDFDMLSLMDKSTKTDQLAYLNDHDGPKVAHMFWKLISILKKSGYETYVRYCVLWLRVLLTEQPELGEYFYKTHEIIEPLKPFVDILYREHTKSSHPKEIRGNAAFCCSIVARCAPKHWKNTKNFGHFVNWIREEIKVMTGGEKNVKKDDDYLDSLTVSLKNGLRSDQVMEILCDEKLADIMYKFLISQTSFQIKYNVGFALLLVALRAQHRSCISKDPNLCKEMIKIVASSKKEKVQRIYLSVFKALLGSEGFNEMCIMYKLFPVLERLQEINFKDEDIKEYVDEIIKTLKPEVRVMSSMERYEKELKNKLLEWGPVHTDQFWKKNYMNFEENKFAHIKTLIGLLQHEDSLTVQVAAHDLGEFARFYPDGRKLVKSLDGQKRLFLLLSESKDEKILEHCLIATQKLLVRNWQKIE